MSERGFSLVEVLLAVVIVVLTFGLISNFPNSIGLIGVSRNTSLAKEIATKQIENLRLKGYSNLGSSGSCPINDSRLSSLPLGACNVTIIDCPTQSICLAGEQNVKQITVSVSWKEKTQRSVDLVTLISEGGLN